MRIGLNSTDLRIKLLVTRIPRFGVLLYSLPVWAYYVVQIRSSRLLLGWLLLLGANFAMFHYGARIDSGRVRPRIVLLYGTLFIIVLLVGLYGVIQFFESH
jgi:hypothetical protein